MQNAKPVQKLLIISEGNWLPVAPSCRGVLCAGGGLAVRAGKAPGQKNPAPPREKNTQTGGAVRLALARAWPHTPRRVPANVRHSAGALVRNPAECRSGLGQLRRTFAVSGAQLCAIALAAALFVNS